MRDEHGRSGRDRVVPARPHERAVRTMPSGALERRAAEEEHAVVGETVDGLINFGNLILLKAGSASYQNVDPSRGVSRWGDYSATSVDPSDPNRFWTIQMIPGDSSVWTTQITELITSPLRLTIAWSGTNILVSWPASATVLNTGTPSTS